MLANDEVAGDVAAPLCDGLSAKQERVHLLLFSSWYRSYVILTSVLSGEERREERVICRH